MIKKFFLSVMQRMRICMYVCVYVVCVSVYAMSVKLGLSYAHI